MKKGGVVYILSNKNLSVLYTGVTSNLLSRITQHQNKVYPQSFTAKYNVTRLVYYEPFHSIEEAILREKEIKRMGRKKKEKLIGQMNPLWKDLFDTIEE